MARKEKQPKGFSNDDLEPELPMPVPEYDEPKPLLDYNSEDELASVLEYNDPEPPMLVPEDSYEDEAETVPEDDYEDESESAPDDYEDEAKSPNPTEYDFEDESQEDDSVLVPEYGSEDESMSVPEDIVDEYDPEPPMSVLEHSRKPEMAPPQRSEPADPCMRCEQKVGEEVCGANGKSYNSLCHAVNCAGLQEEDITAGPCVEKVNLIFRP